MSGLGIVRWLRELDENGAVALARALIHAEAGRLNLPLAGFTMSGRVKARDGGIDGRTNFGEADTLLLPPGDCVWQVKCCATAPSASKEFNERKHADLFEAIRDEADYVLFWTNDPTEPKSRSVKAAFRAAAREVRADTEVHFLFADEIDRLCQTHLGVVAQQSPIPLGGVVSLDVWAAGESFPSVEFQADGPREEFMLDLRRHVRSEAVSPSEVHVIGDSGVGKSRLVFEAMAEPGIVERVLVAPDSASLDRSLLARVAQSPQSRLVLVVDDCEPGDRAKLSSFAGMAQGRLRVITIGSRTQRAGSSNDSRYLDLGALARPASREIALSVGLDVHDADLVAEYTVGYPGLARTLANAIANQTMPTPLIDRVRGHEQIGNVLSSLLPAADVSPLGMLALFERLGFDGDLAPELTLACEILGVDEGELRRVANRELNRFVSTAGRYRRVTPKLFALWLANRFMEEHRGILSTALASLPDSLQERILDQMSAFAGDPDVAETLAGLLNASPFSDGALADVDGGAAQLLRVVAIASPPTAMDAIDRLLSDLPAEVLMVIQAPRRELVWALEVLVWFDELFARAADALLRLAIAENETWSNNATGVVQGLFHVHLGGTSASYEERVDWARQALATHGETAVPVLLGALQNAFDPFESRPAPDFGGRPTPTEWRPAVFADEIAARQQAWDLLLDITEGYPSHRDAASEAIAASVRLAIKRGLAQKVVDDLQGLDWSPHARGEIGEAISTVLRYEELPASLTSELRRLQGLLQGSDLMDRIAYALTQPPWDLIHDDDELGTGRPKLVIELAHELAQAGDERMIDAARQSHTGDQQTTGLLFEELARQRADDRVLTLLESEEQLPPAALLGAFGGLGKIRDDAWADEALARWLESPRLAALVVAAVNLLVARPSRVAAAVEAVDQGAVAAPELGRFLYGAWTRPLPEESLLTILRRLQTAPEPQAIESALGVLTQWLDSHQGEPRSPDMASVTLDLLDRAAALPGRTSPMLDLYKSRVMQMLALDYDSQLDILLKNLRSLDRFPSTYDLELLDTVAASDPRRTVEAVLEELADDTSGFRPWVMWARDGKLLSHLGRAAGTDVVEAAVVAVIPEDKWRSIVHHFDFTDGPDQVVAELIKRSNDDVFLARAAWDFMYPKSGFIGSEADQLRTRQTLAAQLRQDAAPDSALHTWYDQLLEELQARITASEQQEAERPF